MVESIYVVDANISEKSLTMTFEFGQQPGVVTSLQVAQPFYISHD